MSLTIIQMFSCSNMDVMKMLDCPSSTPNSSCWWRPWRLWRPRWPWAGGPEVPRGGHHEGRLPPAPVRLPEGAEPGRAHRQHARRAAASRSERRAPPARPRLTAGHPAAARSVVGRLGWSEPGGGAPRARPARPRCPRRRVASSAAPPRWPLAFFFTHRRSVKCQASRARARYRFLRHVPASPNKKMHRPSRTADPSAFF